MFFTGTIYFLFQRVFHRPKLSVELKGKKGNLLINEGCVV